MMKPAPNKLDLSKLACRIKYWRINENTTSLVLIMAIFEASSTSRARLRHINETMFKIADATE